MQIVKIQDLWRFGNSLMELLVGKSNEDLPPKEKEEKQDFMNIQVGTSNDEPKSKVPASGLETPDIAKRKVSLKKLMSKDFQDPSARMKTPQAKKKSLF